MNNIEDHEEYGDERSLEELLLDLAKKLISRGNVDYANMVLKVADDDTDDSADDDVDSLSLIHI